MLLFLVVVVVCCVSLPLLLFLSVVVSRVSSPPSLLLYLSLVVLGVSCPSLAHVFWQRGIGAVASGAAWCGCCPKCAHLERGDGVPVWFSVLEAARALLDVAQGLYFLHFHHVLHRDLVSSLGTEWAGLTLVLLQKSDNIFVKLGQDGEMTRLLIGDFDTAKNMKARRRNEETVPLPDSTRLKELHNRSSTTGTPGYIPPEVWNREKGGLDVSSLPLVCCSRKKQSLLLTLLRRIFIPLELSCSSCCRFGVPSKSSTEDC